MDRKNSIILVTGATGNQGGAVARRLLKHGFRVKAMTRNPDNAKARYLKSLGAELVVADLDDGRSLEAALKGAWGVFAVQNTWEAGVAREEEQGKQLAELARKQGVSHFVYSSVGSAQHNTGIPHFDNKWRIEQTVRSLTFPFYTILRPVFFMENFVLPWFWPGLSEGKLEIGLKPDTVLHMISVEDIGKFGLLAFERYETMNGVEVDIAGDMHTMPETADILGSAMGRKVEFVEAPKEEIRARSADYATMLEWFDRVGYSIDIASVSKKYGVRFLTLANWARGMNWAANKAA